MTSEEKAQARALGRWCDKHDSGYTRVAFSNGLHASCCPECLKDFPLGGLDPAELFKAADEAKAERAERMPDEAAAIQVLHSAYTRLKELGWRDGLYCPKDGGQFQVIEAGSTGVHDCVWLSWKGGGGCFIDGHEPSRPILFRVP